MSLLKIKNTVENFVLRDNNAAIVIKGKYGVGKTYFWQNLIKVKSDGKPYYQGITTGKGKDREIGKKHYIYLSLFGIDSLKSLKNRLFAEMVTSKNVESKGNKSGIFSKKAINQLEKIPYFQQFTGDIISSITFQNVRNALICIDDLDRKSNKLTVTEIVGLANLLKEQHNCKIVLILNEDGFNEESEKNEFRKQIEKLVDFEINFSPTSEDVIEYVFPKSFNNQEIIKGFCLQLEINNIRILKKILFYIEELKEVVNSLEKTVMRELLQSLILFVWSHYDKGINTPTLEEIETFDLTSAMLFMKGRNDETVTERDKEQYKFFKKYDFERVNDLDIEILNFVRNGYLNKESFTEKLGVRNEAIIQQNGVNEYKLAWRLFNNSFECNDKKFISKLKTGFLSNINYLGIKNLSETVEILRQLEVSEEANILINEFVKTRFDEESMDLMKRGHIDFNVKDGYLKQKLEKKIEEFPATRNLKAVLERFGSGNSFYFEDIEFLAKVSEDEFYNYFKDFKSQKITHELQFFIRDLYNQVSACLNLVDSNDESQKTIGENVKKVIIRIALGSQINKIRVISWFKISEEEIENARELDD